MIVPSKRENIYPLNKENITAILHYYFDMPHGEIEWLYEQKELSINQIEFIAKIVSKHQEILISFINSKVSSPTVSNLMKYGHDAIFRPKSSWRGSKNRLEITSSFKNYLAQL